MIEEPLSLEPEPQARLPWGARQAWWGAAALLGWLFLAIGFTIVVLLFEIDLDFSLVLAVGELSLLLPVWWLVLRRHDEGWKLLGIIPTRPRTILLGCGSLVLFYSFQFCYAFFISALGLQPGGEFATVQENPIMIWGLAFSAILIAPFVEEVFFRGFLFAGFRERYGWPKAAAISALLFSLIHLQPLNMIPIFGLGFLFAYVYESTGSLWPPIIMHTAVNTIGILMIYLAVLLGL